MVNQDLQNLYKLRNILVAEEYIKSYNAKVNEDYREAVKVAASQENERRNIAYREYEETKQEAAQTLSDKSDYGFFWLCMIGLAVVLIFAIFASPDPSRSLLYVFCTSIWVFGIITLIFLFKKSNCAGFAIATALSIFIALLIYSQGDNYNGSFIVFILWPVSNFFFLKPMIGLSLITYILGLIAIVRSLWLLGGDDSSLLKDAERTNEVIDARNEYEQASYDYDEMCKLQQSILAVEYRKVLKPDIYTQPKKAMRHILPENLQTLDMVDKLIWCIEQKYAHDIVEARNWYLEQQFRAEVLKRLDTFISTQVANRRVVERAADESSRFHKLVLRELENSRDAINYQTNSVNATIRAEANRINETNKRIASATDNISMTLDRMHYYG